MMDNLLKEFDLLLMDYEDGTISEADLNKLRALMKEHEELREVYVRHQMIEATMNNSKLEDISIADLTKEQSKPAEVKVFPLAKLLAIAAALVVFAGVIFLQNNSPSSDSTLKYVGFLEDHITGVKVIRNDKTLEITEDFPIALNDRIVTNQHKVLFRYADEETLVMVQSHSELHIKEKDGAKRLNLKQGDIICDVAKQPLNKPMVIYTEDAKTTVLGTQFLLSSKREETKLQVSEGSVRIQDKTSKKTHETKAGWQAETTGAGLRVEQSKYEIKYERLVLINSDTSEEITAHDNLQNGDIIRLSEIDATNFNILVKVDRKKIGGAFYRFTGKDENGQSIRIFNSERNQSRNKGHESKYPYHIIGDGKPKPESGPLSWQPIPGDYTLTVTPYNKNQQGLGEIVITKFKIVK
ncbi:MAG: FecR family protein [Lentisphaeraceae bacterium]|nr:FecR family protein [Lentisphaeraceae bacterium]